MANIFSEDPFQKPTIKHDHGFLDDGNGGIDTSKKRSPTSEDLWEYAKWVAKLEAAEMVRLDLDDATSAYRHFLFGGGAEKKFDYNEFIEEDESGKSVEKYLLEQSKKKAMEIAATRLAKAPSTSNQAMSTDLRSRVIRVGGVKDLFFPYPKTENWQKAIGAHFIYGKGSVKAILPAQNETVHFTIQLTMYAEDMYNFNPKNKDIKTQMPDEANGRFEMTGLAHEFLHVSSFSRIYSFEVQYDDLKTPTFAQIKNEKVESPRNSLP
jgi:hypothetical protein